ncbi:hypothetical protein, partial [Ruminococcus flavefaciens]|uniref:hypothetical protein n=1 Tax=Ruminococcus flavefaciens TaxID=1265 RepID=UPI002A91C41C
QQFQRRRPPTCGTKKFKATISSRCLIYAYFRFWVFYDCTFLDNSILHVDLAIDFSHFSVLSADTKMEPAYICTQTPSSPDYGMTR